MFGALEPKTFQLRNIENQTVWQFYLFVPVWSHLMFSADRKRKELFIPLLLVLWCSYIGRLLMLSPLSSIILSNFCLQSKRVLFLRAFVHLKPLFSASVQVIILQAEFPHMFSFAPWGVAGPIRSPGAHNPRSRSGVSLLPFSRLYFQFLMMKNERTDWTFCFEWELTTNAGTCSKKAPNSLIRT